MFHCAEEISIEQPQKAPLRYTAFPIPFPPPFPTIRSTISMWLYKHKTHSYKHQRSRWTESWAVITTSVVVVVLAAAPDGAVCVREKVYVCVRGRERVGVCVCVRLWQAKFLQQLPHAGSLHKESKVGRGTRGGTEGGVAVGAFSLGDSAYILWLWVEEQGVFLRAATAVFVQRGKKELEKCKEKCQNEAVSLYVCVCVGEMF